jgi:hypothetical protein
MSDPISEVTITRAQFKKFADTMVPLLYFGREYHGLTRFTIPVGSNTTATVSFTGPVGIDEYESLLAHIAYYKTLLPKEPMIVSDPQAFMDECVEKVFGPRPASALAPAESSAA